MKSRSVTIHLAICAIAGATLLATAVAADREKSPAPSWIWITDKPAENQTVYLRKEFRVPDGAKSAALVATADDGASLLIDGKPALNSPGWASAVAKDVTSALIGKKAKGVHVLAASCRNGSGPAGLLARLTFEVESGPPVTIVTDASWKASEAKPEGWAKPGFDDSSWAVAKVVGALGGGPWTVINEAALAAAVNRGEPKATPPSQFKVAKGFKVDLLYTVPKDEQGSWVNMTVDPKGRLIVSDQYGKLYRVTPPPVGEEAGIKVEPIDVEIGEAQGLLWAFDSLYVVVNRGNRYESGLYRVRDTDNDDNLDKVEKLRTLEGGGEHGPHGVVLSPDKKSLYVVAGNATKLTDISGSLVPRPWDEDQILPYLTDGNGFMRDERAPGGCIYRVDPDGERWELVSMGYRNPFDLAFHRDGDLFTYDSDMEWDVNTPWYRPTRVCQADSGSDFGYRNGSGKWPAYYPDSLPPTVNIGPGSPTGVAFGYGAKFPAKYQEALFICDWSYGKLYAVHLTPSGSAYSSELEEFISGTPLPLTDVVVNPTDHAMYFAVGGRKTLSGLYRVTYTGDEPTTPSPAGEAGSEARKLRRSLEAFHGHADPKAVAAAWPNLGHEDRFIRYAARVAIEFQDPKTWQDKALAETNPQASLTALLALARTGDKSLQPKLLEALGRLDWGRMDLARRLELLRVYELAIIRMGKTDAAVATVTKRLDPLFPAKVRELDAELCKLLVALEAPDVAAKAVALLPKAPTQEEQIEYAVALRKLQTGWTPELRRAYFSWFRTAVNFKGGASLAGFLGAIKTEALASVPAEERAALKPILEAPAATTVAVAVKPRPFVKEWAVDELAGSAASGLSGRDFERGRSLFAAASCFSCHRFNEEGGTVGPDLTGVSGRFSPRDLLESIVLPSKSVSDQYQAVSIATADGRVVTGRIVNLNGDTMMINTNMLDPNGMVNVDRNQVEEIKPSPISMMPEGLLNTLEEGEVLDLLAYVLSRGDRSNKMFK